jgi:hypothetical protein
MNNLENPEILSDEILHSIDLIIDRCPHAVFGGSIALNAVGLLNRKISDIDVFFDENTALTKHGFINIPETEWKGFLSDTVTDMNGKLVHRTGFKIGGTKVCGFKVHPEELQHSIFKFIRNTKLYEIKIQNVNFAIAAKIAYYYKKEKHEIDVDHINELLNDIF